MASDADGTPHGPPTWLLAIALVTTLLIGTLAAGATVPGIDAGPPAVSQQTTSGFSGTTDASDADARFSGEATNDTAGWSVASPGDVNGDGVEDVLVGAPRTSTGAGNESGAAYLFFGPVDSGDLDLADADVTLAGVAETDWAGWSVSGAGDLDGDGVDDALIGAPLNDENGDQAGAVYVVHGGPWLSGSISLADANATLYGGEDDRAGWAVSNASDVGGEEVGVLVGALTDDEAGEDAGAAFLVGASAIEPETYLENASDAKFLGEGADDNAGNAVSWAGDVDDDGTADVLVGARRNDGGGNDSGAAYLLSADRNGTIGLADATVTMRGAAAFDEAGYAVSGAGDVNDDGVPDVLVGAPFNDSNGNDSGAAYVVFGGDALPATLGLSAADLTLTGAAPGDFAGWSVAAAGSGDVTCDGVDDLLVGSPWNDAGGSRAGAAHLVAGEESIGGATNLSASTATFVGESAGDRFGFSLGSAGDQNDDGVDDLLFGAPYNNSAGSDAGAAYLFLGDCPTPAVPTPTATPTEEPTEPPTQTPTATPTPTETPLPTTTDAPPTATEEPPVTTTEAPTTTPEPPVTTTETPAPTPEIPPTTTEVPSTTTEEPPVITTEAPPTTATPPPPTTEQPTATTEPPGTTATSQTPDGAAGPLRVTFFGCGSVQLAGPDGRFPVQVQPVTNDPGSNLPLVGPPSLLEEAQLSGGSGGPLIGVVTSEGGFVNPNFDPDSESCAGASAGNPAAGQPGDPLAPFTPSLFDVFD